VLRNNSFGLIRINKVIESGSTTGLLKEKYFSQVLKDLDPDSNSESGSSTLDKLYQISSVIFYLNDVKGESASCVGK
jgi:hypothetical protein